MPFKLALIAVVHANAADDPGLNIALLQRANAWLQRRTAGAKDDLLLIGVGFVDEIAFRAMLKNYGLTGAEIALLPPDDSDVSDPTVLDESVGDIALRWIAEQQGDAIPLVDWRKLIPDTAYPSDGWWWVGVTAADDDQSTLADILNVLLPRSFKAQALTWATILAERDGLSPVGEDHEEHEAAMTTVALARWLTGFDAASENNFYDFSADEAIEAAGLDTLRLGFEAGRNNESALGDFFDGNDYPDEGLAAACLQACLDPRMQRIRDTLADAFNGDASLFWSLYRCIWPDLTMPSIANMDDLLNLRISDDGELDRPWRFVTSGWIEFAEN